MAEPGEMSPVNDDVHIVETVAIPKSVHFHHCPLTPLIAAPPQQFLWLAQFTRRASSNDTVWIGGGPDARASTALQGAQSLHQQPHGQDCSGNATEQPLPHRIDPLSSFQSTLSSGLHPSTWHGAPLQGCPESCRLPGRKSSIRSTLGNHYRGHSCQKPVPIPPATRSFHGGIPYQPRQLRSSTAPQWTKGTKF